MENENKIGRNKYAYLKSISNLTEIEKKQVEDFETDRGLLPEQKQKIAEYFESLNKKPNQPKFAPVHLPFLFPYFLKKYEALFKRKFLCDANNGEPRIYAYTLLAYFFRSDKFLKSPLIVSNINKPSLDKGLLIVGMNGNGKSSAIKAIHKLTLELTTGETKYLKDINGNFQPAEIYIPTFKYATSQNLSQEYSFQEKPMDKKNFWKSNTIGRLYIDDITKEDKSSNFGFKDIVKEVISQKYEKRTSLIMTINPKGNVLETLEYIGEFYGEQRDKKTDAYIYDRLYEMFNVIELKGDSLRGNLE